jgi:TPR repeat protein
MIREIPDSWQSVDLDPALRRIAERAARQSGLPAEEWLERAIRRACPDDFRIAAAPQQPPQSFAPRPTPEPPRPAERGLADLIAAARQVRQPAPPAAPRANPEPRMAPPAMAPLPVDDETAPSLSILDHMARKRRERTVEPESFPETFDTQPRMTERRRGGRQNYDGPERRRAAAPMPVCADEPETDWQQPAALDSGARHQFAESPRDEFAEPLELDRPLRAKRSRKPLIAAVALALIVALGALGAQRLLASHDRMATSQSAFNATPAQSVLPAPIASSQSSAALPPAVQLSAQMNPPPSSMASPLPAPTIAAQPQQAAPTVAALPPAVSLQPEPMTPPAAPQPQAAMPTPPSVVALGTPAPQAVAPVSKPTAPAPVTQPLPQRKAAAPAPTAATVPSAQAVQNAQAIAAARKAAAGADGAPQDPAKLAPWLEERVKNNDPVAEYRLGVLYALGQGVKQDYGHAAQLFQAAADGGVAEAQYNVAVMYSEGMGVQKDPTKAVEWYQKAAAQGNANAAFNLGVAYSNGVGAKQDIQEAARWFRRAAGAGVVNAQFNLGLLYERGEGVPVSLVEAYAWYTAAAAKGDQGAAQRRDHLASTFAPDDLKKAEARAAQLKATIQTGSATPTDQKAAAAH